MARAIIQVIALEKGGILPKRTFDISFSILLILLLSPLFFLLALIIKMTSKGPRSLLVESCGKGQQVVSHAEVS